MFIHALKVCLIGYETVYVATCDVGSPFFDSYLALHTCTEYIAFIMNNEVGLSTLKINQWQWHGLWNMYEYNYLYTDRQYVSE